MRGTWEVGVIVAAAWACTGGAPSEASSTGTRERGARPSAEPVDAPPALVAPALAELPSVSRGEPDEGSRTRLVWSASGPAIGAAGAALEPLARDDTATLEDRVRALASRAPFVLEVRADEPAGGPLPLLVALREIHTDHAFAARAGGSRVLVDVRPAGSALPTHGLIAHGGRYASSERLGNLLHQGLSLWLTPRELVFGHARELPASCALQENERSLANDAAGREALASCLRTLAGTELARARDAHRPVATLHVEPEVPMGDVVFVLALLRGAGGFVGPIALRAGDERSFGYGGPRNAAAPVEGVRVGPAIPEVEGGLTRGVARLVSFRHRRDLRDCVERHVVTPGRAGTLVATIDVAATGGVAEVVVATDEGARDEALGGCVEAAIRGWRYPAPEGDGSARITQPIRFGVPDGGTP